uniref:Type-4 uracil-DNA glycosylase n=1 Tax=Candidatus Kentrum sp. MB TaxID=2138164 RepID=A0A450X7A8_9GAMM|nr:MAG: DNA polymerase [Candidatus Kentron sp. MB]VFK31535.1 MAG: DNA polymerase [Candidatus Kentron sp. MB]VFK75553.1 MAG: DNA polymerase [Candidatus Kentron sp. MB]
MDAKRQYYLNTLGISTWELRVSAVTEPVHPSLITAIPNSPQNTQHRDPPDGEPGNATMVYPPSQPDDQSLRASDSPPTISIPATTTATDWEKLRTEVSTCTACALHKTRTQTVFGVGAASADWMFIGEAPGADEDRQGEPFVGRAGRLLNAMIEAIGLKREEVYIANTLKCRPPNNREPEPPEALACESFLLRQIAFVNPKIILAVGRIAAQNLLATTTPIGQLRGRRFKFRDTGIPLVVTYHPAYLLRSPSQKRRSWEDLLLARAVYTENSEQPKSR